MECSGANRGAAGGELRVHGGSGRAGDGVRGFGNLEGYENGKSYFGGTVGRYANRIGGGQFSIGGKTYTLPKNNGNNTLHGGIVGFNKKIWKPRELASKEGESLEL